MKRSHLDVEAAIGRLRKADQELTDFGKNQSGELLLDAGRAAEAWKAQREAMRQRSGPLARLRFERAGDVNQAARAMPDYIAQMLSRHVPWMPDFDRITAERIMIERIFSLKETIHANPCLMTQPVINDAPFQWRAGETHTIVGTGFGSRAGSVILELDTPPGTVVQLTVLDWSDQAAMVQVPTALPNGIPLRTWGKAVLTRGDVACSDSVGIEFEPLSRLLVSRQTRSESGFSFTSTHSKQHTFTSPVLAPRAEPFLFRGTTDVLLSLSSSEFIAADSPPSFSVVSGPSFTANNERTITVGVTDDHVWNYRLSADFLIVQPMDEAIGGWTLV